MQFFFGTRHPRAQTRRAESALRADRPLRRLTLSGQSTHTDKQNRHNTTHTVARSEKRNLFYNDITLFQRRDLYTITRSEN